MDTNIAGVSVLQDVPQSIINQGEKKRKIGRFKAWYGAQSPFRKIIIFCLLFFAIILILLVIIYGYIIYSGYQKTNGKGNKNGVQISPTPSETPTPISMVDPLTGLALTGDQVNNLKRPPLAVMIENSIPARPQTGLNQADIVYETLAEGGITRFMAIYLGNTPSMIGPVRSARPYFLDWVEEYNAIYAHWGENSDVLPSLTTDNIRNIDAIVQSGTEDSCTSPSGLFCRDETRDAPHNGYGFPQKIWALGASDGWNSQSAITAWSFKNDATLATRGIDGTSVTIHFMSNDGGYDTQWIYNKSDNDYVRYDDGTQQVDRADNTPITTKNIVIQFVNGNLYTSSGGKVIYQYTNEGTGKASVFEDGKETDGTWSKSSQTGRTTFSDASGNPILFDRGRSWITVLVNGTGSFATN